MWKLRLKVNGYTWWSYMARKWQTWDCNRGETSDTAFQSKVYIRSLYFPNLKLETLFCPSLLSSLYSPSTNIIANPQYARHGTGSGRYNSYWVWKDKHWISHCKRGAAVKDTLRTLCKGKQSLPITRVTYRMPIMYLHWGSRHWTAGSPPH